MNWQKLILQVGYVLLGIQWIRMTIAMAMLMGMKQQEIVIGLLPIYYLVIVGFIITAGFLYIGDILSSNSGSTTTGGKK